LRFKRSLEPYRIENRSGIKKNVSELFLQYRKWPIQAATEVRSTLIMAGIQTVRAHGLFSQYSQILSAAQRERILGLAAGIWVPVQFAVEHYTAMDRLAMDAATIDITAAEVAGRTWKHIFAPVLAHATRDDWRPWEALLHSHETTDRSWRGTDIQIIKEGPTEARYDWVGQPCAAIPYFVKSFGVFMKTLINLFSRRAYHRIESEHCSSTTVSLRLSWIEKGAERRSPVSQAFSLRPQDSGTVTAADARRARIAVRSRG
jgi:hypothetical protein